MRKKVHPRLIYGMFGLILMLAASGYGLHATSAQQFCLSCHEMSPQAEEIRYSSHSLNVEKQPITCAECHLPATFGPRFVALKIYSGLKDAAMHFLLTSDGLDRGRLQPRARRFMDDDNCLRCHADLYKKADGKEAVSELGKIAHDAYLGKNGQARSNCAGCHINLAHLPRFDSRLDVNQTFASRLQNKETVR